MPAQFQVPTDDGWQLAMEYRPAEGPQLGICVLVHAMMCDRRTMDRPRGGGLASVLCTGYWCTFLLADLLPCRAPACV